MLGYLITDSWPSLANGTTNQSERDPSKFCPPLFYGSRVLSPIFCEVICIKFCSLQLFPCHNEVLDIYMLECKPIAHVAFCPKFDEFGRIILLLNC